MFRTFLMGIITLSFVSCYKPSDLVEVPLVTMKYENRHCRGDREFTGNDQLWLAEWKAILEKAQIRYQFIEVGYDANVLTREEIKVCECGTLTGHFIHIKAETGQDVRLSALGFQDDNPESD